MAELVTNKAVEDAAIDWAWDFEFEAGREAPRSRVHVASRDADQPAQLARSDLQPRRRARRRGVGCAVYGAHDVHLSPDPRRTLTGDGRGARRELAGHHLEALRARVRALRTTRQIDLEARDPRCAAVGRAIWWTQGVPALDNVVELRTPGVGHKKARVSGPVSCGLSSSGWTRTSNPSINSRMLCQLSYRGMRRAGGIVANRVQVGERRRVSRRA